MSSCRRKRQENEEEFQVFREVWEATEGYEPRIETQPPAVVDIVAAAEERRWRMFRRRRWLRRVAGAAAWAASIAIGFFGAQLLSSPEGAALYTVEVVTTGGETTTTRLPDGTVVRLAPESRLRADFGPTERTVFLDGRAFFAVTADERRSFRVLTHGGKVRALGTRFEVNAHGMDTRLVVVEGRVVLEASGEEVELESRHIGYTRGGEAPTVTTVDDIWPLLAWIGEFLAFESTPLHDVRDELDQRFGVNLIFEDETLAEETISVWFGDEPLEEVVLVICRLVETRCSIEESTVRMSRNQGT